MVPSIGPFSVVAVSSLTTAQERVRTVGVSASKPLKVLFLGDSMTRDPLGRRAYDRTIRTEVSSIVYVGPYGIDAVTGGIVGSNDLSYWQHGGVNGDTIANVITRLPGNATTMGANNSPDVVVLTIGTNDVSALRALNDILADLRTLLSLIFTTWPNCVVQLSSIATWRSGSASGANWADKLALRNSYVAALPGVAAEYGGRAVFVDACAGESAQEIQSDGVHHVEDGYRRWGVRNADATLALMGITRQKRRPYIVHPRPSASPCIVLDAGDDRVVWASNAVFAPNAESFAVTFWWRPAQSETGAKTILSMGSIQTASSWAIAQTALGPMVYLTTGTPVMNGAGYAANAFTVGADHFCCVLFSRPTNHVCFGINGRTIQVVDLVAGSYSGANWNISQGALHIGENPNAAIDSALGSIKRVTYYKGSSLPDVHRFAQFNEQLYVDGVFWDSCVAWRARLDEGTGSPAEAAGVTGTGTMTGSAWGTW